MTEKHVRILQNEKNEVNLHAIWAMTERKDKDRASPDGELMRKWRNGSRARLRI